MVQNPKHLESLILAGLDFLHSVDWYQQVLKRDIENDEAAYMTAVVTFGSVIEITGNTDMLVAQLEKLKEEQEAYDSRPLDDDDPMWAQFAEMGPDGTDPFRKSVLP